MHLTWDKGGEAAVTALAGEKITLASTIPSAPGSPLTGALASGRPIKVKVAACRRAGEGFTIEGRLIDVTREGRAEIAALIPPPPETGGAAGA